MISTASRALAVRNVGLSENQGKGRSTLNFLSKFAVIYWFACCLKLSWSWFSRHNVIVAEENETSGIDWKGLERVLGMAERMAEELMNDVDVMAAKGGDD